MTQTFPETIPLGIRRILNVSPSATIVCPALAPPWKRHTTSDCCASRSTILPLPSSPHCAPTMTVEGTRHSVPERGDGRRDECRSEERRVGKGSRQKRGQVRRNGGVRDIH